MRRAWASFMPWGGLVAGAAAWVLHQQCVSASLHFGCGPGHNLFAVVAGAVTALLAIAGGVASWIGLRQADGLRRFVGRMGALAAGVFTLAILMQTMAALTIPACFG